MNTNRVGSNAEDADVYPGTICVNGRGEVLLPDEVETLKNGIRIFTDRELSELADAVIRYQRWLGRQALLRDERRRQRARRQKKAGAS